MLPATEVVANSSTANTATRARANMALCEHSSSAGEPRPPGWARGGPAKGPQWVLLSESVQCVAAGLGRGGRHAVPREPQAIFVNEKPVIGAVSSLDPHHLSTGTRRGEPLHGLVGEIGVRGRDEHALLGLRLES